MDTLTQLPNRDLWRGFNPDRQAKSNIDMTPSAAKPIAPSVDTCMWCGAAADKVPEGSMKAHVEKQHWGAAHVKEAAHDAAMEFLTGPAPADAGRE